MPALRNLKVLPVNFSKDWNPLFAGFWKSWSIPRQPPMVVTFPHIGEGGPKEAAAFELKKAQYLAAARTSPGQTWFKLVDTSKTPDESIVGGLCMTHWKHEEKPRNMPDAPHHGFEPGSQRRMMSEQLYGQVDEWHRRAMQKREHMYGQAMWILPEYRGLRAAPLLLSKFEELLNKHDVEGYAECVLLSKGLLERMGFLVLNVINFPMKIENPSEETKALMDDFLSESIYLMWRPKKSEMNKKDIVMPSVGWREAKL
ncbi:uncharacterized protein TRIREDRAFT_109387 [Trichoderma reesei QM6a]|uniref:Predicted protein n=2 Tax=Hypocrea jecorina TaxID=51453 RepID=G0RP34_HYPJQ|nr:uncharacterized protein TRIREDRAFT_109387 [Trichoderma reesei QM6a]EGR47121.1 predicted protein [Trichoderma reesei QM6a]ETR99656.1 hypothetical protein M419DRAFT_10599 [Trichoderma reesei RUT C-30]